MSGWLIARLFGRVSFRFGDQDITPRSRKLTALLVLLTLREGGVRRGAVAEILWGPGKLANLRQALYELRRLPGANLWLVDGSDTIGLRVESDVAAFESALNRGDTAAAVALCAGDLVADQPELEASAYQEWLADARRRLAGLRVTALARESVRLEAEGALAAARETARAALALDPLHEPLYRVAMRASYGLGDVEEALATFLRCVQVLGEELGQQPDEHTRALAESIERREPLTVRFDIGTMSGERQRLLQVVAVADGSIGVTGIASVLERPEFDVADDMASLERGGVIRALRIAPSHRQAVMSSLGEAWQRLLHERVAALLVRDADADQAAVATHLLAAGDTAGAAQRFILAARAAVEAEHVDVAVELLYRALWAGCERRDLRLEACLLLEGAASHRGDKDLQDAVLTEAERLAWDLQSDEGIAEVRMRRSRQQLTIGNVGQGLELALEALEIALRLGDEQLVARARNATGGAHYFAGDLDGAESAYEANLGTSSLLERYRAHSNLGSLAAMRGALDEAYPHFEEALTLARSVGPQSDVAATLNNLAATAERAGAYARAVKHFKDGIEIARRSQSPGLEGRLLVNLAVVYARMGELGPAWNTAAEVEELAESLDDERLRLSTVELRADVLRSCGMLSEAVEAMSQALDAAAAMSDERKVVSLGAQLKTIEAVRSDDVGVAVEAIEQVEAARLTGVFPWLWLELALAASDARTAIELVSRAAVDVPLVHQRVVADIAMLRAGLLAGADATCRQNARGAAARLAGHGADAGALDRLDVIERPLGRLLLAARAHLDTASAAGSRLPVPDHVIAEVEEQGRGLPSALTESLRGLPRRWSESLTPS